MYLCLSLRVEGRVAALGKTFGEGWIGGQHDVHG
jgi:hypothetical protein